VAGALAWTTAAVAESRIERVLPASVGFQKAAGDADASGDEDTDEVGAALTQRTCKDQCHTEDRITETRRAAFEWARLIVDMEARGARATAEEFATIQRYLQRHYGFVNVNRAQASELRAVLGLSETVAAAVIDHRKRHGPFADVAALSAVPGLDRAALEARSEALRFK
jgi:hypothetical protein